MRGCQKFSFIVLKGCRDGHSPCTCIPLVLLILPPVWSLSRHQRPSWHIAKLCFLIMFCIASIPQLIRSGDWILGLKIQILGQICWWMMGRGRLRSCSFWLYNGEASASFSTAFISWNRCSKGSGLCLSLGTSVIRTEEHTYLYMQLFGITTHNL